MKTRTALLESRRLRTPLQGGHGGATDAEPFTAGKTKTPPEQGFRQSGRRDSNSGPLVPQTSALTRLRHAPRRDARYQAAFRPT